MSVRNEDRDRELDRLLDADPAGEPLRPMWPAVSAGLAGRSRRLDPFFAFGVPATAAVGILLGVLTGGGTPAATSTVDETVGTAGLTLEFAAESGSTLGEIWWDSWSPTESGTGEGGTP
jgi:hypothetical protein